MWLKEYSQSGFDVLSKKSEEVNPNLMFKEIEIINEEFKDYDNETISDLSKVNLFVGQNNSGKSRLIRKLFKQEKLRFIPNDLDIKKINSLIKSTIGSIEESIMTSSNLRKYGDNLLSSMGYFSPFDYVEPDSRMEIDIYKLFPSIEYSRNVVGWSSLDAEVVKGFNLMTLRPQKENLKEEIRALLPNNYSYNYDVLYFPTLRGLRPLINSDFEDHYKSRTIKDYFDSDNTKFDEKIYTGLTFYSELKKLLLGFHDQREMVAKFEDFLSNTFFKGEKIDLIPNIKENNDVVFVKIGDQPDYPIYELGDGIQMLIILMYPLFFNPEEKLKVFIEEPEIYLHPGMQRILLDSLTNPDLFPNHQFFISTHSNHFLDMTADFDNISIYTLKKNLDTEQFVIENVENSDSDVLNLLGVKNSSIFLSNCTIWVEGITDRIYVRKFLEVFLKQDTVNRLKEDIHYSFVEYGGGNITHWSFLDDTDAEYPNINVNRLCSKLFLISDRDGAGLKQDGKKDSRKTKKYERYLELTKKLGDRYYCLRCREIENLLSPRILKETILKFEKSKRKTTSQNELNFDKLKQKNYKHKPLGEFINNNVLNLKRSYSAKSGTLNEKVLFAKRAVSSINGIDDLSDEAILLCTKLISFIKEQNQI